MKVISSLFKESLKKKRIISCINIINNYFFEFKILHVKKIIKFSLQIFFYRILQHKV